MQIAYTKEDLIAQLTGARVIAKMIDYRLSRLTSELSSSRFRYSPFDRHPRWLENQFEAIENLSNDLKLIMQDL